MFTYAKVNKPIIGADFLRAFGLLVDIRNDSQAAGALARGSTLKLSVLAVGAVNDDIHRLIKGQNLKSKSLNTTNSAQHYTSNYHRNFSSCRTQTPPSFTG